MGHYARPVSVLDEDRRDHPACGRGFFEAGRKGRGRDSFSSGASPFAAEGPHAFQFSPSAGR
jgi:hypothetical protein